MYLAPQNIPRAVVLTFGNKAVLYCTEGSIRVLPIAAVQWPCTVSVCLMVVGPLVWAVPTCGVAG